MPTSPTDKSQSDTEGTSEAHNSYIHHPHTSSTHDEPLVTNTLDKLEHNHLEQISKSASSRLWNEAKIGNNIWQKMQG